MMSKSPGPRPLDEAMDARRRELRLRWRDVAEKAGISYETLRTIRHGQYDGMRPLTETGIEQALQWQSGSVAAILAGGDPVPAVAGDPKAATRPDEWNPLDVELMERVVRIGRLRGPDAFFAAAIRVAELRDEAGESGDVSGTG